MPNDLLPTPVSLHPSPNLEPKPVDPSLYFELSNSIKGTLHPCDDPSFQLHSKLFNGDVISGASLLARPFDVQDVSLIVVFCQRHSLSLSVKAGGYGTHGHAVQGDVIIDISLLNDIDIENMNSQGGFTSIKDMPSSRYAGKGREDDARLTSEITGRPPLQVQDFYSLHSGKRRAAEAFGGDNPLNILLPKVSPPPLSAPASGSDSGSSVFLRGGPLAKVRRTDWSSGGGSDPYLSPQSSQDSRPGSFGSNSGEDSTRGSGNSSHSSRSGSGSLFPSQRSESVSTAPTSGDSAISKSPPAQSDPFGYISDSSPALPPSHSLPTFDPPAVVPHAFAQPGSNLSSSFSMEMLSPTGLYTPTRVNPIFPHAYVTFGAGAKQKDVDLYTSSHPLPATSIEGTPCYAPYHVPFSAHPVGSSVMLLGGFGFLSRLHGLSIDNLVEVEMVLADGRIIVVNEEEHEELWWAMRGAGPAFGIATRYKAKAYPVPVVFAGNLLYKFRRSTAASLIKHFRDCVKNVPRELYANVILTAGPDGDALLVIQICYLGSQEQGVEFLQAITSWDGEQCLLNEVSEKNFLNQQDSLAQLINGKAGRKWFIRSDLLTTLSDETIHETVMRFADTPVGCTWLFELSGGNVSDEHGGCFPASARQATWTIAAFHQWELDQDDPRCIATAEDWLKDTLAPASAGGPFPSFFGIHESTERIKGSFGDSWQRLCELKRKYDPEGFFKHNFWPLDKENQPKNYIVPTHTEF